jgi:hypothetical protein
MQTLTVCARNGAVYASDITIAQASPYDTIQAAALADAGTMRPLIAIEVAETCDGTNRGVKVTAKYTFHTITQLPGLPKDVELRQTQCMRLPRSAQEEDSG